MAPKVNQGNAKRFDDWLDSCLNAAMPSPPPQRKKKKSSTACLPHVRSTNPNWNSYNAEYKEYAKQYAEYARKYPQHAAQNPQVPQESQYDDYQPVQYRQRSVCQQPRQSGGG